MNLTVKEAYTRDVGRGVCRIDYDSMDSLKCATGDVIKIKKNDNVIVAKCLPLYPTDEKQNVVRLEKMMRTMLHADLDDTVEIQKSSVTTASHVTVSPVGEIPFIDARYMNDALEGVPLIKSMNVIIPYFGSAIEFHVESVTPSDVPAVVTATTVFKINNTVYSDIADFDDVIKNTKKRLYDEFVMNIKHKTLDEIVDAFNEYRRELDEVNRFHDNVTNVFTFVHDDHIVKQLVKGAIDDWITKQKSENNESTERS